MMVCLVALRMQANCSWDSVEKLSLKGHCTVVAAAFQGMPKYGALMGVRSARMRS